MTPSPINRFRQWYFALEQAAWSPVISRNGEPSGAIPGSPAQSGGKSDANFHGPFKAARRLNLITGNPRVQPFHQSPRQFAEGIHNCRPSLVVDHDDQPNEGSVGNVRKDEGEIRNV